MDDNPTHPRTAIAHGSHDPSLTENDDPTHERYPSQRENDRPRREHHAIIEICNYFLYISTQYI
jgi:hypothetical protein